MGANGSGGDLYIHKGGTVMSRNLGNQINVRLNSQNFEKLVDISKKVGLTKAEIARRAVQVGLDAFDKAWLPGTSDGR